jgi:hypothetical protein
MLANNNNFNSRISQDIEQETNPTEVIKHQLHHFKLLNDKSISENIAQGSMVVSENRTFNRDCWKCRTVFQVKGLRFDDSCPKCGYKTNNPDFVRTLHENLHLTEALKFGGLHKDEDNSTLWKMYESSKLR